MLKILISPSKTMDYKTIQPVEHEMKPLSSLTKELRSTLEKLDAESLKELYKASDKVTHEALELIEVKECFKAIELFNGAVFKNLNYFELDRYAKTYIDDHVLIFSALYGLIPAKEGIRPYRLDLSNSLEPSIVQLTAQWKEAVNASLQQTTDQCILDLASTEYRKLIDRKLIPNRIQIDFKDLKDGKFKTVGTYAKMARGQFLKAMACERVEKCEAIKQIAVMGYAYNETLSTSNHYIFTR